MLKIKRRDKYSRARGGNSKLLNIKCSKCDNLIFTYQKDGEGNLMRCYLDRIISPNFDFSNINSISDLKNLNCKDCNQLIGTPMIYEPEKRFAYRMVHGNFKREKHA